MDGKPGDSPRCARPGSTTSASPRATSRSRRGSTRRSSGWSGSRRRSSRRPCSGSVSATCSSISSSTRRDAAGRHHLGLTIDDFDAAYDAVATLDVGEWGAELVELPSGQVQLYFRDPAGNLIELNWPDADTLDRSRYPSSGGSPSTSRRRPSRAAPCSTSSRQPRDDAGASAVAPGSPSALARALARAPRLLRVVGWALLAVIVVAARALGALLRADDREVGDVVRLGRARPEGLPDHAR